MKYYYENKEVMPEKWQWAVKYRDGSFLKQFENGLFHRIGEVNQDNIAYFEMFNGEKSIKIDWISAMRLIHKYRNAILNAGTPDQKNVRIYIFGYKYRGKHFFYYILPDDSIIVSTKDLNLF